MQKIKIGHRAKFGARNKYFLQILFPVRAILIAFNDLGRSVTPSFLSRNRFNLQLSPHCPKMTKMNVGSSRNFKTFVHGTWNPAILRLQGARNYSR